MQNQSSREPRGYNRLALLYGSLPEIAVFKKFRVIHADNLNLLQAEIVNVDAEYREACAAYRRKLQAGDIPPDEYVRKLQTCAKGRKAPFNLYKKRQKLLSVFDAALLSYRAIEKLPPVSPNSLSALEDWYYDPHGGQNFRHGLEGKIWDNAADLTCLSRSNDAVDGVLLQIRHFMVSSIFWLFKDRTQPFVLPLWEPTMMSGRVNAPLTWYSEEKVTAILGFISTILASILPALSIFVLVSIQSLLVRIGIIMIFTFAFSLTTALMGRARRAEIWAVSAAFSAVLVVFVGGPNSSNSGGS